MFMKHFMPKITKREEMSNITHFFKMFFLFTYTCILFLSKENFKWLYLETATPHRQDVLRKY